MAKDYQWVRGWGALMGSHREYVNGQVEAARQDNAPPTATYRTGSTWNTVEDITNPDTLVSLLMWAERSEVDPAPVVVAQSKLAERTESNAALCEGMARRYSGVIADNFSVVTVRDNGDHLLCGMDDGRTVQVKFTVVDHHGTVD